MNLNCVNEGSALILRDLNPMSFEEVRYSTAVELNTMDLIPFKLAIVGVSKGLKSSKRSQLEGAVSAANKINRLITRTDFNEVIGFLRKTDFDHTNNTDLRDLLLGKSIDAWLGIFKNQKTLDEIKDEGDMNSAIDQIIEINSSLSG